MEAILSFSHTASQLLRRKKVKRDHIYQYLAENGIIEPTSSDKPTLIRRALLFWGSAQEVGLPERFQNIFTVQHFLGFLFITNYFAIFALQIIFFHKNNQGEPISMRLLEVITIFVIVVGINIRTAVMLMPS